VPSRGSFFTWQSQVLLSFSSCLFFLAEGFCYKEKEKDGVGTGEWDSKEAFVSGWE
jgi:hypothetical protein